MSASSHAETLAPDDLLVQSSTYLEEVSSAISEEAGTVDKFIGDGIMAFWNAPVERSDQLYAPALPHCGRRAAWSASTTSGRRKDDHVSV
jgi:class 3 adenylate cyclase